MDVYNDLVDEVNVCDDERIAGPLDGNVVI
jgi:hypothetical protein